MILGVGVGRLSVMANATSRQGNQTVTNNVNAHSTHLGMQFGLGTRLYAGKNWGIQPEFKYGKYFSDGGSVVRIGVGLFFQWKLEI